ncbi:MAG: hypothetical protein H6669_20600 [Ardenticatenaceae bacterium]|nr:hypothetical protein [Ardenticatenaceae bacterium]
MLPSYLSIGDATAVEGSPAQFTVTLSEPAQITFTVQIATADLTALVEQDYNQLAGTLTFAPGQTSQNVQVATLTDTIDEDAETFRVQLSSPQYVFIADGEGMGTITDGNAVPSIRVADRTVTEGDAGSSVQAVFAVSLNSASGKTVTVNYATTDGSATAGADYLAAQGQVQFAPGVTTQNVSVTVLGDDLREGNETFTLQLSSPVNASLGDATGQGTITDDDIPAFSISDSSRLEGDSGTSSMVFTVWLSKPSTQEATVKYITSPGTALAGADYIHTGGTLTFAAGETMKTITVAIVGDEESEPNETFSVSLNTPTGGAVIDRSTATGLILDDGGSFVYLPMIVR